MDEYYDLYYPDGRNARRVARAAPPGSRAVFVPPPSATPAPASSPFTPAPVAAAPAPAPGYYGAPPQMQYGYPPANPQYAAPYPQPYAAPYPQPYSYPSYSAPYAGPYGAPSPYPTGPAPTGLQALFANASLGEFIELGTDGFAALQNLPAVPTATDDVATNLQNILIFQAALADHVKKNERVRALGRLVGKLLG
jgi:hypothetical protein